MRICGVFTLLLLLAPPTWAQTVPAGWKVVKDPKATCQIAVPPEWTPWSNNTGAAVYLETTTALAVVTNQPGQEFKALSQSMQKMLDIPKERMFENTAKRVFYQEKVSAGAEDPNAYSASVPGGMGTCSCRVVFLPSISAETVKKIVLTLGLATEPTT